MEVVEAELRRERVAVPRFTPAEPAVFTKKRRQAQAALAKLDLPTDKKCTNWQRLGLTKAFDGKAIGGVPPQLTIKQDDYDTGLKTIAIPLSKAIKDWPEHVATYLMGEALPADAHYFSALSGATYRDGVVVVVPDGVRAEVTATLAAEAGKINSYRTIIVIGRNAEVTYTERARIVLVQGRSLQRAGTVVIQGCEVYCAENARLKFYSLQRFPQSVVYLAAYRSQMARSSRLDWLVGSFGSGQSQIHVESGLAGEGAETNVHGVYYGNRHQHADLQLVANHLAPHTTSDTYARGILADKSKGVYRGMIKIQRGAHGSSADQNGHAMLLADTAHADAIPGLEIDANDVTAGHGATVGQVDAEQLFYLMSRGLTREQATDLIITGFFEDLFKRISQPDVRRQFQRAVAAKR